MLRRLQLFLVAPLALALPSVNNTVKSEVKEIVDDITKEHCHEFRKAHSVLHNDSRTAVVPLERMHLEYRDIGVHYRYNITTAAKQILDLPEFNPNQKLYIHVHGFNDYPDRDLYNALVDVLLSQGECKVLLLDAKELLRDTKELLPPSYLRVSNDIRFIGDKVGEFLADMVKMGLNESAIHITGISFGAHLCGYIGKGFTKLTGSKVGRITGFDPSGPCFDKVQPDMRLNADDAQFVDVIHTDERYGIYPLEIGDVNYYPNGGITQPNCTYDALCSHSRSIVYFTESVSRPDAFLALKCEDWESFKRNQCEGDISPMGIASKPGTTGKYYLRTHSDSPYGLGEEGLKWEEEGDFENEIK